PEASRTKPPPATVAAEPMRSAKKAASTTPIDWPMKRKHANSETDAPRAAGNICVALVCMVLWNMKKPKPASRQAGATNQTEGTKADAWAMPKADAQLSATPTNARPGSPKRGMRYLAPAM